MHTRYGSSSSANFGTMRSQSPFGGVTQPSYQSTATSQYGQQRNVF